MTRLGGKQDLNKIQIAERRRRRCQAVRGRSMPPGTHPWTRQESEPWLTPMAPRIDTGELIRRINRLLPKPGFLLPRFRVPREIKTKVKG